MTDTVIEFDKGKQYSVLAMNTLAFTVNFAVWTMFAVIGIKIKAELGLNETEFGLLVATPILTGSLVRLPLGLLTDRFGGRVVYFIQMVLVAIATYGLAFADQYWQYLAIGLCVGLAGGSFAIGIAYTSAWFEKEKQGTALGFTAAIAALGLFFIPAMVALSIETTGSPRFALTFFIAFYATCLFVTWWWYRREGAEVRCD